MRIDLKNTLLATIVAALSATVAVGQAQAGKGRPDPVEESEKIVITLQTSPFLNAEPACVGVQIGINLLMDDMNGPADGGAVTPADSVTLFPTLQGVDAVSPRMAGMSAETAPVELFCTTPGDDVLLTDLIGNFVLMGGKIVVCPLCWKTRYPGEKPLFDAEVGDAVSVHNLFLTADKVVDF